MFLSKAPVEVQVFSLLIFARRLTTTCCSKCSYCWGKKTKKQTEMKKACCASGPSQRVEKACNKNRKEIIGVVNRC